MANLYVLAHDHSSTVGFVRDTTDQGAQNQLVALLNTYAGDNSNPRRKKIAGKLLTRNKFDVRQIHREAVLP